jgi:hypothetical protein
MATGTPVPRLTFSRGLSIKTKTRLQELGIEVLRWPEKSPDLAPIEKRMAPGERLDRVLAGGVNTLWLLHMYPDWHPGVRKGAQG